LDLALHALYALTASLPAWALIHLQKHILFHSLGAISILAVSTLGILANLRLLQGAKGGFPLGLATTALFLITRGTILIWVICGFLELDFDEAFHHSGDFIFFILFILSLYLFYRLLYHISAYCHTRMFLSAGKDK
jgi:hypothetical protein